MGGRRNKNKKAHKPKNREKLQQQLERYKQDHEKGEDGEQEPEIVLGDINNVNNNNNNHVLNFKFSIPLDTLCVKHYDFLKELHDRGVTRRVTPESLRRYKLWINMLIRIHDGDDGGHIARGADDAIETSTSTTTTKLVPPKDVAWLWHCHRLAPVKYQQFVQEMVAEYEKAKQEAQEAAKSKSSTGSDGQPLGSYNGRNPILMWQDPHPSCTYVVGSNFYTEQVWTKFYPNETFHLDPIKNEAAASTSAETGSELPPNLAPYVDSETTNNEETLLLAGDFDLLASAQSQAEFYWQMQPLFESSESGFTKPAFDTAVAIKDYRRFLNLIASNNNNNNSSIDAEKKFKFVPTYLIDLMWHTHMTGGNVYDYHSDCELIYGTLIDHDDSYGDGDRDQDGVLNQSFLQTAKLWLETYNDDTYEKKGGYRGQPPTDYFPIPVAQAELVPDGASVSPIVESNGVAVAVAVHPDNDTDIEAGYTDEDTTDEDESDEDKEGVNNDQDVSKPDDTECTNGECWATSLVICLVCAFIAGAVMLVLGLWVITPVQYACGGTPPTSEQIAERGAPVCLNTNVRDGSLCLLASEDPDLPPVWCQYEVAYHEESSDFYLWWSPCTKCGTAWRMAFTRTDDSSQYKLLEPDQPDPDEVPRSTSDFSTSGWHAWDTDDKAWYPNTVDITVCPADDVDENGIPNACYQETRSTGLWATGIVLLVGSIVSCVVICFCLGSCEGDGGSGGNRSSSGGTTHYYGGGGCGGGGGGCGGGGGGCGGC